MAELSAYELACGGMQRAEVHRNTVILWREHGCYHVRARFNDCTEWEGFRTLGEARKAFRRQLRRLSCQ